jgi:hypothetical protein
MDPKLAGLSAEDREAAEALIKEGKEGVQVDASADEEDMPLLLKYRLPGLDNIDNEDEKYVLASSSSSPSGHKNASTNASRLVHDTAHNDRFRFDVESRPEETTASAYDRVPVEKFGEAMLRGMLWKPGDPIGNTNKAYVSLPPQHPPKSRKRALLTASSSLPPSLPRTVW